jgi:dienelactone hydrolase
MKSSERHAQGDAGRARFSLHAAARSPGMPLRPTGPGFLSIALALTALIAPVQAQNAPSVPGGDPAIACGQKPNGRAYWTEYGFCDLALKGPAQAKGLVLWSHGVSGDKEQFASPPPPVVRRLATAGWDVIRINRNNLYEKGWATSGPRHRDDAIERSRTAKAQGYKRVMLAGQSYGAVISLEANAKSTEIDGVLALSPGHGSDAGQASGSDRYRNLNRYLLDAVAAQKGGRVIVLTADGDLLHPDRGAGSGFGAQLRAALAATGRPYVVFDETGPIHGHGAGTTNQFSIWFGSCVVRFLDPAQAVAAGETVCKAPDPIPRFILPADLKRPTPSSESAARWLGAWEGTFGDDRRGVAIVVEATGSDSATIVYSLGAGLKQDQSMGYDRYTRARLQGDTITVDRGRRRTILLTLSADGRSMTFQHTTEGGSTLTGTLARSSAI